MGHSSPAFISVRAGCSPVRAASVGAPFDCYALVGSFGFSDHNALCFAPRSAYVPDIQQESGIEPSRRPTLSKTGLIEGAFFVA